MAHDPNHRTDQLPAQRPALVGAVAALAVQVAAVDLHGHHVDALHGLGDGSGRVGEIHAAVNSGSRRRGLGGRGIESHQRRLVIEFGERRIGIAHADGHARHGVGEAHHH